MDGMDGWMDGWMDGGREGDEEGREGGCRPCVRDRQSVFYQRIPNMWHTYMWHTLSRANGLAHAIARVHNRPRTQRPGTAHAPPPLLYQYILYQSMFCIRVYSISEYVMY